MDKTHVQDQTKRLIDNGAETFPKTFAKYRIEKELGRGGMGAVYKAYDTQSKIWVALKRITKENVGRQTMERFLREIATTAKLNHPNIVRLYESGMSPQPYFTMEHIEGYTLSHAIHNRELGEQKLLDIIIQVCKGLLHAHRNKVMHRDIKPSNIMVTKDGVIKVMDFGLAKLDASQTQDLSRTGNVVGTFFYMPPEQVLGKATYKSDIYSVGAVIYEALTYRTIYQGESPMNVMYQILNENPIPPRQLNPEISPYFEAICLKCIAKKENNRYKSLRQLLQELENFRDDKPIIAKKYTKWDAAKIFMSQHKIIVGSLTCIFVIFIAAFTFTLKAWSDSEQARFRAEQAVQKKEQQQREIRSSLHKVMKILNYAMYHHEPLREDKKFCELSYQILPDIEKYGHSDKWHFIKAYIAGNAGEDQKSMEYYNKAIINDPKNVENYINRGRLYAQLGKINEAFVDYNKAIELKPSHFQVYLNRGIEYFKQKQYEKALRDYNKAIELYPSFFDAYMKRALFYATTKQYTKAVVDYSKAIEINSHSYQGYINRGILYLNLQQYAKALRDYNKAIELKPELPLLYAQRGHFFYNTKQNRKAYHDYTKAIDMKLRDFKVYHFRGMIYQLTFKKYNEAVHDYTMAIKIAPKNIDSYYQRAQTYTSQKKYRDSIRDYTKVIEMNDRHAEAYFHRGIAYSNVNDYDKTLRDYNKAIAIHPQYFQVYNNRGNLYADVKDYDRALFDYNKAIAINPRYFKAYDSRGNLYKNQKKYRKALSDYNKAIQLAPNFSRLYNNRGNLYFSLKDYQKALNDYNHSIKLQPTFFEIYYNRGYLYLHLRKYNLAINDFKKVVPMSQTFPEVYKNLYICYKAQNKNKEAQRYLQKFQQQTNK
ncbi:serine/threonine-protein kinase [Candidatus Uabimicrobium amorphum]|uniref:non-specific serine/threonine protein kinase n=1 Tax=Uabimicrobium amorphum TaxID=2596890 RepID=A0A5S9F5L3_UABAM|nr:serine/threonine-protein kinase [Candidatus Uabimicrobium amorphum]BBM86977.1 protein kinase [Candidatus Uabimicrobium amorphum]